jgi:hydrogenase maturation protein HypF
VFRLAEEGGLDGFVLNDERGVVVEVEGDVGAVERFAFRLPREAPALAAVESVRWTVLSAAGEHCPAASSGAR